HSGVQCTAGNARCGWTKNLEFGRLELAKDSEASVPKHWPHLTETCGVDQLRGGLRAGIEGAVHGIAKMFETNNDCEGALLMDAANAFNALSALALWNSRVIWLWGFFSIFYEKSQINTWTTGQKPIVRLFKTRSAKNQ
ncbi:unnamed protein product, partial [Nesidiocoris tenuis]